MDRARAAQHLVRTIGYQPERFARMRDQAVHVALTDGVAVDRLAEALDVRPEQVRQMAREHVLRADVVRRDPAPEPPSPGYRTG